ncbi:MAG: hypothetical protein RLZ98_3375 [Pseudomonadota bacterium]|jgi:cytochrome c peroxidase
MRNRRHWGEAGVLAAVFVLAVLTGFAAVEWHLRPVSPASAADVGQDTEALDALKRLYQRPHAVPVPPDNIPTPERIALGERLFNDPRLSVNDTFSCATCHDPGLSFSDGVALGKGVAGEQLARHTPTLWNVAFAKALFWDGRARSLEEQARGPMEHPKEMAQSIGATVTKLRRDASYAKAFADAFPNEPELSPINIVKALASYERTLISPPTRFDRWVNGDPGALTPEEIEGFKIFNGKGRCASCHSGWAFTDYGFHDIGLPASEDLGRGPVAELESINRAFKTPSLRELVWTAPYMHDGSLASLEAVMDHYISGVVDRPTRSPDIPLRLALTPREIDSIIAFMETLSSENPPKPEAKIKLASGATLAKKLPVIKTRKVGQKDKVFVPGRVEIGLGEPLTVLNDDVRPLNVTVFAPEMKFNSGVQASGESTVLRFKKAGSYEAYCGIHPNMRLEILVK